MMVKDHSAQNVASDAFLWCLSAIFLFAFASLYVQVPGLYGKDGILPARNIIYDLTACVDKDKRCPMWQSWGECKANPYWMLKNCRKSCDNCPGSSFKLFLQEYNLLLFTPNIGLDTETGMEFLCLTGIVLAMTMLISARMRNRFSFFSLFLLYYSQHKVGQIFLWYQWDALLLETGFLAVLVAPWNISFNFKKIFFIQIRRSAPSPYGSVNFWLVKWLLFRLMFSSGVVKLTFMDDTWWGLTALNWHYESQCIPSPLAWYFHHLPGWFQKLSVVMTYVIEIAVPFLFFMPVRCLRLFSCFAQVFLQILIYTTGNYNFFNLLTMVLCLSLVDDKFLGIKSQQEDNDKTCSESARDEPAVCNDTEKRCLHENLAKLIKDAFASKMCRNIKSVLKVLTIFVVTVLFIVFTVKWFSLKITSSEPVQSRIAFSADEFFPAVRTATYLSMVIGFLSLLVEIFKAFVRCLDFESRRERFRQVFKLALVSITCLFMFGLSLVMYTGEIDRSVRNNIPHILETLHDRTYHLEIVHSYGLFRSMTGVGGRPEVIIKGGHTPTGPWKEFDFLYKPGDVTKSPSFVAPHQPRLDWQMWFAALRRYDGAPWFLSLLHKLILGKPQVLGLLDRSPFEDSPPQFIKVDLYRYHFTWNQSSFWNALIHSGGEKSWWSREYVSDYTPFIINRNDSESFEVLIQNRFNLLRTDVANEPVSGFLHSVIYNLRSSNQGRLGPRIIFIFFSSSLVLLLTKIWWRKKGYEQCSPLITQLNENLKEPLKGYLVKITDKLNPLGRRMSSYTSRVRNRCINFKQSNVRKLNKTHLNWRRLKDYATRVKRWSKVECLKKTT